MLKILRGLGWTLAGLLVLAIVVWCASRMWPVPESRLQAQQRLEARLPANGRNGYPLLWTLAFDDLDAGQREQALAEDVRRWEADPRGGNLTPSHLAANHAELRARASASCGPSARDCLAQVRADPQRFAEAHAGHRQLHARLDALAEADHFVSPFRPKGDGIMVPLPTYGLMLDATSARALAYVQGTSMARCVAAAVACSWVVGWCPVAAIWSRASSAPAWCRPMRSCWPTCWWNCLPTTRCRPNANAPCSRCGPTSRACAVQCRASTR